MSCGKSKSKCKCKMKKKEFLFNPENPKKSFDLYIDKDPSDSIPLKYSNLKETKESIKSLEKLYKKGSYPHKRISQVAMILKARLRVIKEKNPKINKGRAELAERYFNFLKERTKLKTDKERKDLKFSINKK